MKVGLCNRFGIPRILLYFAAIVNFVVLTARQTLSEEGNILRIKYERSEYTDNMAIGHFSIASRSDMEFCTYFLAGNQPNEVIPDRVLSTGRTSMYFEDTPPPIGTEAGNLEASVGPSFIKVSPGEKVAIFIEIFRFPDAYFQSEAGTYLRRAAKGDRVVIDLFGWTLPCDEKFETLAFPSNDKSFVIRSAASIKLP